ncbi:MAG: type II toxin-antitoxin system RelE/ParE family toxin [Elusimicrobia bacterium]|nr:type II toxin-antitoxin system RelE/ParE family toxin [Elusimicrobiota bacterium]MBI4218455.1 type II toxin-antitoxin system RelE/ParE family toxin [Elusimicrobiota bacterium]
MKIILLPQAQEDLNKIYDPLLTEVCEKILLLKEYPHWGASMSGPFRGYRSFVVSIFRVVYRIVSRERIEVAYVRHCRRDLKH